MAVHALRLRFGLGLGFGKSLIRSSSESSIKASSRSPRSPDMADSMGLPPLPHLVLNRSSTDSKVSCNLAGSRISVGLGVSCVCRLVEARFCGIFILLASCLFDGSGLIGSIRLG